MPTCLDGRSMRCCKSAQLYLHFAYLPRECHALLRPPAVGLDQRPTAHDHVHVLGVRHAVSLARFEGAVVDGALTEVSSVCFVLFRAGVVALSLSRVVSSGSSQRSPKVPTSTSTRPGRKRADSDAGRYYSTKRAL